MEGRQTGMNGNGSDAVPALFLGHGSPMNAIDDTPYRRAWEELGRHLAPPTAVLCISAHWETRGVYITSSPQPPTIHDFYGFPRPLYEIEYPAPGSPELASRVQSLIRVAPVHADKGRGLDHGAWSVLRSMFPRADVPVVQLSLDTTRDAEFHYALGRELGPLRDEGILVVGSGNIVHNLALWHGSNTEPYDWACRFDTAVADRIRADRHRDIVNRLQLGPDARHAVPTPEHYLPLMYPLAMQRAGEAAVVFNQTVESSLSMTSVVIGNVPVAEH